MRDNPTRFNTKATKEEDKDRSIPFQVDSILATVLPDQNDRLEIIQNGLPNINAGFPSDHLPIGAMFVQDPSWKKAEEVASSNSTITKESDSNGLKKKEKSDIQMERESYLNSLIVIRRHNAILQTITEWLVSRGAKDIISHQPLYRWKWLKNDNKSKFKRKGRMRAPDLCCVLADSVLVIVEITATTKPDQMRQQKLDKYKDLPEILLRAPLIANMESPKLSVWDETFVILLDENGNLPEATVKDLNQLTKLSSSSSNSSEDILERDSKEIFDRLQKVFLDTNSTTKC